MTSRRIFLALFAPAPRSAFTGKILSASYDLRTRTTILHFESKTGPMAAQYDHDTSRISRPTPSTPPDIKPVVPTITLRLEAGSLIASDSKRKISTLMVTPALAKIQIVYPNPVHPDLSAVWSIEGRIYYTNNDYRNVYLLPPSMLEAWAKPARLKLR